MDLTNNWTKIKQKPTLKSLRCESLLVGLNPMCSKSYKRVLIHLVAKCSSFSRRKNNQTHIDRFKDHRKPRPSQIESHIVINLILMSYLAKPRPSHLSQANNNNLNLSTDHDDIWLSQFHCFAPSGTSSQFNACRGKTVHLHSALTEIDSCSYYGSCSDSGCVFLGFYSLVFDAMAMVIWILIEICKSSRNNPI